MNLDAYSTADRQWRVDVKVDAAGRTTYRVWWRDVLHRDAHSLAELADVLAQRGRDIGELIPGDPECE